MSLERDSNYYYFIIQGAAQQNQRQPGDEQDDPHRQHHGQPDANADGDQADAPASTAKIVQKDRLPLL